MNTFIIILVVAVIAVLLVYAARRSAQSEKLAKAGSLGALAQSMGLGKRKQRYDINAVSDPQQAAVVMLALVGRGDDMLTETEKDEISRIIVKFFGIDNYPSADSVNFALWVSNEVDDAGPVVKRMVNVVRTRAGQEAVKKMPEMATAMTYADGPPTKGQQRLATIVQQSVAQAEAAATGQN
jgi:uncharacterized tellurite resistance protein B-like protein